MFKSATSCGKFIFSSSSSDFATSCGKFASGLYNPKKRAVLRSDVTPMRIDDEVKRKAEIACDALGLNMTTAINLYLVKLGNEMRIPFEVSVDPFYSSANQKVLEESIRQLEEDNGIEHNLIEVTNYKQSSGF